MADRSAPAATGRRYPDRLPWRTLRTCFRSRVSPCWPRPARSSSASRTLTRAAGTTSSRAAARLPASRFGRRSTRATSTGTASSSRSRSRSRSAGVRAQRRARSSWTSRRSWPRRSVTATPGESCSTNTPTRSRTCSSTRRRRAGYGGARRRGLELRDSERRPRRPRVRALRGDLRVDVLAVCRQQPALRGRHVGKGLPKPHEPAPAGPPEPPRPPGARSSGQGPAGARRRD